MIDRRRRLAAMTVAALAGPLGAENDRAAGALLDAGAVRPLKVGAN